MEFLSQPLIRSSLSHTALLRSSSKHSLLPLSHPCTCTTTFPPPAFPSLAFPFSLSLRRLPRRTTPLSFLSPSVLLHLFPPTHQSHHPPSFSILRRLRHRSFASVAQPTVFPDRVSHRRLDRRRLASQQLLRHLAALSARSR